MIITRIRRGASRTNLLVKRNLSTLTSRSTVNWVRSSRARVVAIALLAVRIATLPVPVAKAATLVAAAGDAAVPPSTLAVVSFQPTTADALQITPDTLQAVQVGQSNQAIQLAAQQAAVAAQAAAAAAAVAQAKLSAEERARILAKEAEVAEPSDPDLYNELYQRAVADIGVQEADAMMYIGERESGIRLNAVNANSGACGIWQALPCSKMGGMDLNHQYAWVKAYAYARYGSFENAKTHWLIYGNW